MNLVFETPRGQFQQTFDGMRRKIARAATAAMKDTGEEVRRAGRAEIARAGFSRKWQNALRVNVYPQRGASMGPAAFVYHKIPYAGVFERGARISGRPMLWIPLDSAPERIGGRRITPRSFIAAIGQLHVIKRPGRAPLLAAYMRGKPGSKVSLSKLRAGGALARLGVRRRRSDSGRARGVVSVPIFFGVPSVTLRKRFNLAAVFQRAAASLPAGYRRHLVRD